MLVAYRGNNYEVTMINGRQFDKDGALGIIRAMHLHNIELIVTPGLGISNIRLVRQPLSAPALFWRLGGWNTLGFLALSLIVMGAMWP